MHALKLAGRLGCYLRFYDLDPGARLSPSELSRPSPKSRVSSK